MAEDNPNYSTYNGMIFTQDLTSLILVPEGMGGNAVLPDSLVNVPACVLSRCIKLSTISFAGSTGSESLTSENGILYNADKTELIAAPAGIGSTVNIAAECQKIAEGAFVSNADISTIVVNGAVLEIATGGAAHLLLSEDAAKAETIKINSFNEATVSNAKVVINGSTEEEAHAWRTAWEEAGFTNFSEGAKVGQEIVPVEGKAGFAFTLLDNFTLGVRWDGGAENAQAPSDLRIPEYGEINGVRYAVTEIADSAFIDQTSFETISIPSGITRIGDSAFANNTNLKAISIPGSVTDIDNSAFAGCNNLVAIDITSGLRTIGDYAFSAVAANTVVLPDTVESVGDYAFANSPNLETVLALGDIPEVGAAALSGNANVKVYVPYNENEAYAWTLGAPASNNHLLPYGVKVTDEPVTLEEGQSVNLFDNGGYLKAPEGFEVNYFYKAKPLSVNQEGIVEAKQEGSTNVEASISFEFEKVSASNYISEDVELVPASFTPTTSTYRLTLSDTGSYQVQPLAAMAARAGSNTITFDPDNTPMTYHHGYVGSPDCTITAIASATSYSFYDFIVTSSGKQIHMRTLDVNGNPYVYDFIYEGNRPGWTFLGFNWECNGQTYTSVGSTDAIINIPNGSVVKPVWEKTHITFDPDGTPMKYQFGTGDSATVTDITAATTYTFYEFIVTGKQIHMRTYTADGVYVANFVYEGNRPGWTFLGYTWEYNGKTYTENGANGAVSIPNGCTVKPVWEKNH
ncbi:leucine-rich repeat domain-containing protein, partial [Adlercreutzia sp. ZJ154]|uniref:leucine-rich repeat domain-containing protein n=1 Tax=Adlercreutzia sp. ZJ154 TaxID=2709790 RepID=UPI0013EC3AB9